MKRNNGEIPALEKLARDEVGDDKSPPIFVTEDGVVRAVFTKRSDLDAAINFADSLPSRHVVVVEDRTGIAWENETSEQQQMAEED